MPHRLPFSYWSDPLCSWALVAQQKLDRVLATRKIAAQAGRRDVSGECWRRAMPASSWSPAAAIKAVFALGDGRGTVEELVRGIRPGGSAC
jgi:hypothetical protein